MIHHLNCGILHAPSSPQAACHCLLLEREGILSLVDTGIGLLDIADPVARIGRVAIEAAGFQFQESLTAARQVERMGFGIQDVRDIVLSHADPDHAGGLSDFPAAAVHLSEEEHAQLDAGNPRYSETQFIHGPRWVKHASSAERWFGLEARRLPLSSGIEAFLIPLFGHTFGHCGVAVRDEGRWLLHVGDAYYLRAELSDENHPVSELAQQRADDDVLRRESLSDLRRLVREHSEEIQLVGYHDFSEIPQPEP